MDDIKQLKTMVQSVINGQSSMKAELLTKINRVGEKLSLKIAQLKKETKKGFVKVNKGVDKVGLQVARLEDDTPINKDFDDLVDRVTNL